MEGKCLYEVLGVDRSATGDEIRSAYRKLALRFHPDKIQQGGASPEVCREATERFQAISRAYEVLGDPNERSWYDSHRSAILTGVEEETEYEMNLWPYFAPTAYSGYGDTGKGFYAVYRGVFASIFTQEILFAKSYLSELLKDAPTFGGSNSNYESVTAFYGYWQGFRTVKNYCWCDKYHMGVAENRKERRYMAEENAKIRKKEQREFNETVRQLVNFVKKRDKRVLDHQVQVEKMQAEKELARKARAEEIRKEKEAKVRAFKEQEWTQPEEIEDEEDDLEEEEAVKKREEFYCVACEKRFKSQKQWENHEKSKKHIERAAELKKAILEEERRLKEEESEVESEVEAEVVSESEVVDEVYVTASEIEGDEDQEEDDESDEDAKLAALLASNSRKNRSHGEDEDENEEDLSGTFNPGGKKSKRRVKMAKESAAFSERKAAAEVVEAPTKLAEAEVPTNSAEDTEPDELDRDKDEQEDVVEDKDEQEDVVEETKQRQGRKKKGKKGKGSAAAAAQKPAEVSHSQGSKKDKSKKGKAAAPPSSTCEVCGLEFETRNSLFKHIDSSKHFALKGKGK